MRVVRTVTMLLVLACAWLFGCAPAWRPPLAPGPANRLPAVVNLAPYLPDGSGRPRVYERRDLKASEPEPARYVRACAPQELLEGSLVGRVTPPMARYLQTEEASEDDSAQVSWPQTGRGGAAFFLTLDPPVPRFPESVSTVDPATVESTVHWFDYRGRPVMDGQLERTVHFEGHEPVTSGSGESVDCVRLHIETRIRFNWGPRVNVTEYVWLARGLGDVRRIERLHGLAWLLPFEAVRRYDLIRPRPSEAMLAAAPVRPAPAWSTMAVHLDRVWPAPRIAGLAVEFAAATDAVPLADATPIIERPASRSALSKPSLNTLLRRSLEAVAKLLPAPTRTHN